MIRSAIKRVNAWRRFGRKRRDEVFSQIFETRYWGDDGSVSGPGSRPEATRKIKDELPRLFRQFKIASVYDAPCGDFAWMKDVVQRTNIRYVGADIVPAVIEVARDNAAALPATFLVRDIVVDAPPDCDLWICRDCLFHLDHKSVYAVFENFATSDCSYLLITNHPNARGKNRDIVSGDYRDLNMFKAPYQLPSPVHRFDDSGDDGIEREMVMFDRPAIQRWISARE